MMHQIVLKGLYAVAFHRWMLWFNTNRLPAHPQRVLVKRAMSKQGYNVTTTALWTMSVHRGCPFLVYGFVFP